MQRRHRHDYRRGRRRGLQRWTGWLTVLLGTAGIARAEEVRDSQARAESREILSTERDESWRVEDARFRVSVFGQEGNGYQSRAGTVAGPGSERAVIFQPMGSFRVRQNARVTHEVVVPIDIVSSASANAIDVISSASAVNESAAVEITNRFQLTDTDELTTLLGYHHEEPLSSGAFGLGYRKHLADDNAVLSITGQGTFDRFKYTQINGKKHGERNRTTLGGNVAISQLLSETTVVELGYGITLQSGTLETTYFTVPLADAETRIAERFPRTRLRQAASASLAQHVPASRTTLRADYRYYRDDFGLDAHTAEVQVYQYVTRNLVVGPSYRYYKQTGVDFFGARFPGAAGALSFRTSDSDLAPFSAQRYGLKLMFLPDSRTSIDLTYFRYARSNDLSAQIASVGYAVEF